MKKVAVLPETCSIFNLQKLCVCDEILPLSTNGKFAFITISDNTLCLCQIFLTNMINPYFCNIDLSVCCLYKSVGKRLYPPRQILKHISLSDIIICSSLENIKSVLVSIVFHSPLNCDKWKNMNSKLSEIVKDILKPFVLMSGSVVTLDSIKSFFDVGINCCLIENIGNASVGRILSSTKIKINKVMSKTTFDQIYCICQDLPILGGLGEPMKILKEVIKIAVAHKEESSLAVYKQVLILGPPGCGKTSLVQTVARDCGLVLKIVVGPELISPLPGEAELSLTEVFDECKLLAKECQGGCILLLDDVDSLCGRREGLTDGHVMRLSNVLLTLLETVNSSPGLIVIGTSSRPQNIDQSARRPGHFDHEIHIGVCNEGERASIVRAVTHQYGLCDSVSDRVAKWTPGFVGADLALLTANVGRLLEKLGLPLRYNLEEELLSHWCTCVGQLQPISLRGQLGVIRGDKGFITELGGVDKVKQNLLQAIQWPLTNPDAFKRLGIPQPKGVLLYGPPGCAKTSLVRAIAADTNTTFLSVSAAQIYSPYVGDAERTISELFHRARIGAPSMLFIDEIDALVGCRGNRQRGSQERILTAFLTEMDGVGVRLDCGTTQAGIVVVASTNRPDVLDPALTRPGRFDRLVYIGPPDSNQRLDILHTITKKMPMGADVDLTWVAQNTELYSGADLSQLCKEAGLAALTQEGMSVKEVRHIHWLSALKEMKPSLSLNQILLYKHMSSFGV